MTNAFILGSSKGLGDAIAKECLSRGWNTLEAARSYQDSVEGNRTLFHVDLSNQSSVESLVSRLQGHTIDQFYWVAGKLLKGSFADQSISEILETHDTNIRNPLIIAHYIFGKMSKATTPKHFVVISSSSGKNYRDDEAVYVETKFGQVGLCGSLGKENRNPHLHVSLFLPGGMKTPLWDQYPNPSYDTFLDPSKVAKAIIEKVDNQTEPYLEHPIPRGSL